MTLRPQQSTTRSPHKPHTRKVISAGVRATRTNPTRRGGPRGATPTTRAWTSLTATRPKGRPDLPTCQRQPRPDDSRRARCPHEGRSRGARHGDHRAAGPPRNPLRKAAWPRLGNTADPPRAQKQMQRGRRDEDAKKHVPREKTGENSRKRTQ